ESGDFGYDTGLGYPAANIYLKASYLTTGVILTGSPLQTAIIVNSAVPDGTTNLTVTYTINYYPVTVSFDVSFYQSADPNFGGDTLLGTFSISNPADWTVGVHAKTYTLGSGIGELTLPGFGSVAETDSDYHLLAVIDPSDVVPESFVGITDRDNTSV